MSRGPLLAKVVGQDTVNWRAPAQHRVGLARSYRESPMFTGRSGRGPGTYADLPGRCPRVLPCAGSLPGCWQQFYQQWRRSYDRKCLPRRHSQRFVPMALTISNRRRRAGLRSPCLYELYQFGRWLRPCVSPARGGTGYLQSCSNHRQRWQGRASWAPHPRRRRSWHGRRRGRRRTWCARCWAPMSRFGLANIRRGHSGCLPRVRPMPLSLS